jgi:Ser/Thr protein kinase RdoA (MazF antagonist)
MGGTRSKVGQREQQALASAWSELEGARFEPLSGGLLHATFAVEAGDARYIAQRLSPVFSARIHDNIEAVTRHLAEHGVETPRLLPTRSGDLYADLGDEARWRLQTRLPGAAHETCPGALEARSAGALLARFHGAVLDLEADLAPLGFPFHDTPRHLADLAAAVDAYEGHPMHTRVAALAREIMAISEGWPDLSALPTRVVHGDLKFSNVLFRACGVGGRERAVALIDLDTLCRLPLYFDLGDAWRSWCNARPEDEPEAELDMAIFRASAEGYLETVATGFDRGELESLVIAIECVSLELAARFAADTLEERYFDWDAERFASSAEHNWARARGQWSLLQQALETREERRRFLLG